MTIEIDKRGLVKLVKSTKPSKELFEHPDIKHLGRSYISDSGRTWHWTTSIDNLTEEELYKIYLLCN